MPAPLHVQLSSPQRRRLRELRRDPALKSRERDRVEMYLLSADGMTVPRLARHFACCEATMRRWLRQFEAEGLKAVRHQRRGLGPDRARRQVVRRALNGLLSRKRTWTAAQLAQVLAEEKGLVMKPPTVRKYLHLMGARYRRTQYSLRHRQDPVRAAAARDRLGALKKKARDGQLDLFFLDETGFSPCLPPTHTWCRRRRRPEVPHESPQGQRVNVMAARAAPDAETEDSPPPLTWWAAARPWKGEDLVAFLQHVLPPDRGVPRVVVLDNASIHRAVKVREALPDLHRQNLHLWYLPPYSPELNDIEHTFRKAKHEAMPQRLQPHARALTAAVHACFRDLRDELVSLHLSIRMA